MLNCAVHKVTTGLGGFVQNSVVVWLSGGQPHSHILLQNTLAKIGSKFTGLIQEVSSLKFSRYKSRYIIFFFVKKEVKFCNCVTLVSSVNF
jgi:hypothetical protein